MSVVRFIATAILLSGCSTFAPSTNSALQALLTTGHLPEDTRSPAAEDVAVHSSLSGITGIRYLGTEPLQVKKNANKIGMLMVSFGKITTLESVAKRDDGAFTFCILNLGNDAGPISMAGNTYSLDPQEFTLHPGTVIQLAPLKKFFSPGSLVAKVESPKEFARLYCEGWPKIRNPDFHNPENLIRRNELQEILGPAFKLLGP